MHLLYVKAFSVSKLVTSTIFIIIKDVKNLPTTHKERQNYNK